MENGYKYFLKLEISSKKMSMIIHKKCAKAASLLIYFSGKILGKHMLCIAALKILNFTQPTDKNS